MRRIIILCLACLTVLSGCGEARQHNPGLYVPEENAVVILPDSSTVQCELADTPYLRNVGLSQHERLPVGSGMLFVYPEPRHTSFWMPPQMRFNIDIIFLNADRKIIHIAHDCPPCQDPEGIDCESYSPERKVSYVLELPAGQSKKHSLELGDTVDMKMPKDWTPPVR